MRIVLFPPQCAPRADYRCVIALTKIDLIDKRLKLKPDKAFQSASVEDLVAEVSEMTGFAENQIWRCKLCKSCIL